MIGFSVDREYFERFARCDALPQVAARKFEAAFLEGFAAHGRLAGVIGFFAASTFPSNRSVWFPGEKWRFRSAPAWTLPFVNLPLLKLLSRVAVLLAGLVLWVGRLGRPGAICVYSAHTPFLLAAYAAKAVFRIPYYVIIPDLPIFMDIGIRRTVLRRVAKRFDWALIRYLVSKSAGVSAVTRHVVPDTPAWRGVPFVVIEGLLSERADDADTVEPVGRPYFLYSGGLNESYGVKVLIDAFMSTDLDAELLLCGAGELFEYIHACSTIDPRIRPLGFLAQDALHRVQRGAVALMLTRSPNDPYVKYSFPSKLLEYMATGVPVIATRLPGIPSAYFEFLTVISGASAGEISDALKLHLCRVAADRMAQGQRAKAFVSKRKNPRIGVLPLLRLMETNNV